jgi:thioredoxin-related protein
MKLNALILLVVFFVYSKINCQNLFMDFNQKIFEQKKTENPVLLLFTAKWCGSCKSMKKEVFSDSSIANLLKNNFVCFDIDVDLDKSGLSLKYDISGLPAYVFLNSKEEVIYQTSGFYESVDFSEKLKYIQKKIKGKTTEFDELNACKDAENSNCDEFLKKFLDSGAWKDDSKNTRLAFDFAVRDYKIAWDHFNSNREIYYKNLTKKEIENELYLLVLSEAGDIIKDAEDKKHEPDWIIIEKLFKKYYKNGYQIDLFLLKSLVAYKSGKWESYLLNKEAAVEAEVLEIDNSGKSELYLEKSIELQEHALSFKGLTKNNETKMYELCYKLLTKAEKNSIKPSYEIYEELDYVCSKLGKTDESERYFDMAQELKNKSEKNDKQKDSDD